MRILIATDHYPPFIGGAHRQAQLIAAGMAERGHEVSVATTWQKGLPVTAVEAGVTVHRVRQLRTAVSALVRAGEQQHQPPFPDPLSTLRLRRIIAASEPDLIHTYGWISYSVAAALGRRRIPLLLSARDYGYFCANRTLLRQGEPCSGPAPGKCATCAVGYYGPSKGLLSTAGVYLSRPLLARKTTGLHSVSSFVEEVTGRHLFGSAGPPGDLVRMTIPSFQSLAPAESVGNREGVREHLGRLPAEPYILYVGAFRKVKGLETLFEAYRRIEQAPPLVLMGTFERDSPTDFPPGAVVLEDVPNAAVMAAWDGAMFGVMPSLWPEPFGATVAEAMNRGKPVIGTTPGGHVDMIGDSAGLLVPQGDVAALAEAMSRLIGDSRLRDRLGRAASERAKGFTAGAVLPRFERAYRDVVAAGESAAGRSRTELREHFEIERELAQKLREAASKPERRRLYGEVYRERSERIPHHPLVRQAAEPEVRLAEARRQVALLAPFLSTRTRFCELGAGDGAVAREVAPLVDTAVALDVTDALGLPSDEEIGFEFRVFDGFDLGMEEGSLDVVYSNDVVEHLHPEDVVDQIRSVHRALRPGGHYICVTPNRLSGAHDISRHFTATPQGFHLREYTATELAEVFRRSGFSRVDFVLTMGGRRISPVLPAVLLRAPERLLERLPQPHRRRLARGLAAVKIVASR